MSTSEMVTPPHIVYGGYGKGKRKNTVKRSGGAVSKNSMNWVDFEEQNHMRNLQSITPPSSQNFLYNSPNQSIFIPPSTSQGTIVNTLPSTVLSNEDTHVAKHQRRRTALQDITNVATNLSTKFHGNVIKEVQVNCDAISLPKDVFKHKSRRFCAVETMNNPTVVVTEPKKRGQPSKKHDGLHLSKKHFDLRNGGGEFLSESSNLNNELEEVTADPQIYYKDIDFSFNCMEDEEYELSNEGDQINGDEYDKFGISSKNDNEVGSGIIGSLLLPEGAKPFFSQLYIYDTENEVSNRINDVSTREHDGRTYNLPSASEVAALVVGDIDMSFSRRDIIVEELSGIPQRINELHVSYIPLQYPILFLLARMVIEMTLIIVRKLLVQPRKRKRKRISLPSSFTGGARYMIQNYQDAIAICRWAAYPDLFITFTCNPAWPEITRFCQRNSLSPSDRPDILSRIFKLKLQSLMKTIKQKKIFGTIRAEVYTIEFQKRGLPHAYILLFLDPQDKIKDPDHVDKFISAEIPDKESSLLLHDLVKRFMIHGPCSKSNPKSTCMKDQKCSKYFPKKFNEEITIDDDGYPTYKRRDDGKVIEIKGIPLDNRYVVPYNPLLLSMFQAHINVEKCNQSTAIKYLFKYISKGDDRVVATIYDNNDEIQQYYNCRYVSTCEGSWRIFGFDIHHRYPSVERLSYHLPNQQCVIYCNTDDVADLLDKPRVCESQFLAWFKINRSNDDFAKTLTYFEFPQYYVYQRDKRTWKRRKRGFVVGRIPHASPTSGELYFLRILLTKVRGPSSFDDIKTVEDIIYPTFKEACFALGLLDDDQEYINAIREASIWASGISLRKLFVSMLLCCCLSHPEFVWKNTSTLLSEDLLFVPHHDPTLSGFQVLMFDKEQVALQQIDALLKKNGKTLHDFPSLPLPEATSTIDLTNHLILQELNYDRHTLQLQADTLIKALNTEQRNIFDHVISSLSSTSGGFFFVYGYGGTGKTFLWNALSSSLHAKGDIVLTVASSGIAATLLPSGRIAHSRFAIPIQITESSVYNIKHNSPLSHLIQCTKLIIWDEAPMVQRYCIEAFDRTLKDIMHCNNPFGGKCVIMGDDFRQILLVIPKGTRATIVNACISSSHLWDHCTIFQLTKNMRLCSSSSNNDAQKLASFSQWLLDVGDRNLGEPHDGTTKIEIPPDLLISNYKDPMEAIVSSSYPNLLENLSNLKYFNDRAILAPTIESVNEINDYMCSLLPGESVEYLSCDSICKSTRDSDCFEDLYTIEFLNTINSSGLPPHRLKLKVGTPVMLLRNIDQALSLCNGTRLRITHMGKSVIEGITLNGSNLNQKVLIHRMDMNPSKNRWPFRMQRRQFPISLSFAMTINKSQGQSLRHVRLYLSKPVFTHGQLYVALSRVRSMDGLKILVQDNDNIRKSTTTNVVYKEIFRNLI
ncbi:uncharacterized protein LOC129302583 [Prosopis cineraria]|uniref:uncharacterized protein LOC129302583 n=1 Tax=Prosopis cineraria TaxID=364024 RepID=UPI00241025A3|nr:uncharacterized protein LOC129302583 [Prosopis cineraria]